MATKFRVLIRVLENDGWQTVTQRGSHRQIKHGTKAGRVTVAGPAGGLRPAGNAQQHPETSRPHERRPAMKYAIIIEKTEEGTVGGYAPDLPGVGVVDDTADEVRELLREAIAMHIEGLRKDGQPIPQPSVEIDYVETTAA